MHLPEGRWRWVKVDDTHEYARRSWHLASTDDGHTFCGLGEENAEFTNYEEMGELVPIRPCADCTSYAKMVLGL